MLSAVQFILRRPQVPLHRYESLPQNYVQIFKMYAWSILKTELIASFELLLHSLSRRFWRLTILLDRQD